MSDNDDNDNSFADFVDASECDQIEWIRSMLDSLGVPSEYTCGCHEGEIALNVRIAVALSYMCNTYDAAMEKNGTVH